MGVGIHRFTINEVLKVLVGRCIYVKYLMNSAQMIQPDTSLQTG